MKYIPALDGVRGLCILAVMLSHYGVFSFGGWLGVEIFFVLSGFLITAILLESRTLPLRSYLGTFYMRRVLRIFPVYLATTGLFALIAFIKPHALPFFSRDGVSLFTYTYNLVSAWRQSHITTLLPATAYTHFWSLSVEEQFYFIWPFLVFFLNEKWLRKFVLVIIVLAPVMRGLIGNAIAHNSGQVAGGISLYVLTTTHLDSFMLGAALNLWSFSKMRARTLCAVTGSLLVVSGLGHWWLIRSIYPGSSAFLGRTNLGFSPLVLSGWQHVWGYTVIALFGAGLIHWARKESPGILTWPPLVHLGKVSYGAYIFHLPLLLLFVSVTGVKTNSISGLAFLPLYIGVVAVVASSSFYAFEKRFLNLKKYFQYKPVLVGRTEIDEPLQAAQAI